MSNQTGVATAPKAGAADLKPTEIFSDHFATLVAILANRLTRGASNYYRRTFGIGVMEWRILYALRETGDLSAFEIAQVTDLDKAAVSRSIRVLEQLGYVRIVKTGRADRRILAVVTEAGRDVQRQLYAVTQDRQEHFLADFTPDEVELFRSLLQRMYVSVTRFDHPTAT